MQSIQVIMILWQKNRYKSKQDIKLNGYIIANISKREQRKKNGRKYIKVLMKTFELFDYGEF